MQLQGRLQSRGALFRRVHQVQLGMLLEGPLITTINCQGIGWELFQFDYVFLVRCTRGTRGLGYMLRDAMQKSLSVL